MKFNQKNGTDYQIEDVYFKFTHEVMSNEQENEQRTYRSTAENR